jgi:hypothetical protein
MIVEERYWSIAIQAGSASCGWGMRLLVERIIHENGRFGNRRPATRTDS